MSTLTHTRFWPSLLANETSPRDSERDLLNLQRCYTRGRSRVLCDLSHRWGSRICFQLTHANLDELRAGVELTALPLLFRDAAWLAYGLEYCHLWIDSLCIMQGDFEDWTRESAQMCETYAGSSLNIAASVALHSDESMFRPPRNLLKVLDCNIKATWQCFKPKSLSCDTFNYSDSLRKLPLNRRAWVLQERLLAPKTIHFGNDQVYWECGNGIAAESHTKGIICNQAGNLFRSRLCLVSQSDEAYGIMFVSEDVESEETVPIFLRL
jgi:hypothetical protein